jgi:pSer/pThr/pTyr-binding forkhead associated (FHA) protein
MAMAAGKKGLKAFCSYSHRDEELRNDFAPYLGILAREGLIRVWHDRKIPPGDDWAGNIDEELNTADLVLLFISADFIESHYAYDVEMKRALELHDARKAKVVPVLLRPTPLGGGLPFERLQMIPRDRKAITTWPNRDQAWSAVTSELRELAQRTLTAPERPLAARRILLQCQSLPNQIICVFDETAVIGRSAACDVPLIHSPTLVGKQHARFFFDQEKRDFLIDDLETRNGTTVDGTKIRMKTLRLGSRVDFAGVVQFTFWRYETDGRCAGALLYSNGGKEVARYLLAPFKRVEVGTRVNDAVQLPLLSEGRAIGSLETDGGTLYFTPERSRERVKLNDGAEIDAMAVKLRLTILE